jgi:hypothetical protein
MDADRLKTATVLEVLNARETDGRTLDAIGLAAALRSFAVFPRKIRVGRETAQGYAASDVCRAYESLVGPVPGVPGSETGEEA